MSDTLKQKRSRALAKSDIRMLQRLLDEGLDLAHPGDENFPAFHEAINYGNQDFEILDLLKRNGADIDARERYGENHVLHWVIGRGQPRLLHWLLNNGADVNAQNADRMTPLLSLMRNTLSIESRKDVKAMMRECTILLRHGATVTNAGKEGKTALHYTAWNDLAETSKIILRQGARVDAEDENGRTPLHIAADRGCMACARLLLKHGADPDRQDARGKTALHLVAGKYGHQQKPEHALIAALLVRYGASTGLADTWGDTPLISAASDDNYAVAECLLAHGADVNANDGSPLRDAVFYEYDTLVRLLLEHGADPALSAPVDREAAIHIAASEGYLAGLKMLLAHGATIESQNIDGETPLAIAVRRGNPAVARYLLHQGADARHTDHYGNTPLFLAQRRNHRRLIDLLNKNLNNASGRC